jgi:hypothetical protein
MASPAVPSSSYSFAITMPGDDSSALCPEGSILDFAAPVVQFVDTPAVYHATGAPQIYVDGFILAYATDADASIISATQTSNLPSGVSLNTTDGSLYVSNAALLVFGVYNVSVSVEDSLGWTTVVYVLLTIQPAPSCLTIVCGVNLSCCDDVTNGPQCYTPDTYICSVGSQGPVLCGNKDTDQACGTACYDTTQYVCCANVIYGVTDPSPCNTATAAPTSAPTAAPSPSCATANCGVGLSCCDDVTNGPLCYTPNTYSCPVGSYGSVLCGIPSEVCGFICYDDTQYVCCDNQIYGNDDADIPCSTP